MNTQDKTFAETYRAGMQETFKEYRAPVYMQPVYTYGPNDRVDMNYQVEIKREVRITLMEEDYQRLAEDAQCGRDARYLRGKNPALLEAWDKYRMLLALTEIESR